jgi:hypothetical protein
MAQSCEVPAPVRELAARLGHSQPMRRGSLSERYVKCGKPGCGCAEDPKARHGPYYSLTRAVGGADPLPLPEPRGSPTGARADREGPAVSASGGGLLGRL